MGFFLVFLKKLRYNEESWKRGDGMNCEIRSLLLSMADKAYGEFSSKLIPESKPLIGVRLPQLRRLAKEIAAGDWRSYLASAADDYFEETMLQGMVIGCAKMALEERLGWIEKFVPKIDNWSLCDSFCAGLKFIDGCRKEMWGFIAPYLESGNEFDRRFALIVMLDFFVLPEYIDQVLERAVSVCLDDYYVKMGVAWLLSVCYVKFPELTMESIDKKLTDQDTCRKTFQKILESRRITPEQKDMIRQKRRDRNV